MRSHAATAALIGLGGILPIGLWILGWRPAAAGLGAGEALGLASQFWIRRSVRGWLAPGASARGGRAWLMSSLARIGGMGLAGICALRWGVPALLGLAAGYSYFQLSLPMLMRRAERAFKA